MTTYTTGDQVYYTGDMANESGEGIIIKVREANAYAPISYDVHLYDGRDFRGVYHLGFSGPGRRFWLLSDWKADQARIAKEGDEAIRRALAQMGR